MRLCELFAANGTYVGLRVLEPSAQHLLDFCDRAGIKVNRPTFKERLHTTVIYSRKHCRDLVINPDKKYKVTVTGYDIFSGSNPADRVLVMKLNAPEIVARHLALMSKYNATYDHPVFIPHITLDYKFKGNDLFLPIFDEELILGDEYVEDLDLDWAANA